MAANSPKPGWLRELRDEFPHIPADVFIAVLGTALDQGGIMQNFDAVRELLAEEERRAIKQQFEEDKRIGKRFGELGASLLHRKLALPPLPPDTDLEHVRAYLVHGLIQPGRAATFAGSHSLGSNRIRENVARKLLSFFDLEKHQLVEDFLLRHGVTKRGRRGSITLNIGRTVKLTAEGEAIFKAVEKFMFEHRPT